ncbi:tyrosine-type recombinase/integrase [Primorskyibacter sp. S87]|uniref:tyrosine-type recombinase/integrase n=1 Tax=Primorskyibacter sp. S87 TaxID=3415126 RepID=UPI003C7A104F
MTKSIPIVLKFGDWPLADRSAWDALFAAREWFDDSGPCVGWSEGTRTKRRQGYGQWLSFLMRMSPAHLTETPSSRVSKDTVQAFVEECEARLAPISVSNLVSDLYVVIHAMSPETDWGWLNHVSKRLTKTARRQSLPPPHDISANEVLHRAVEWIERHDGNHRYAPLTQAIRVRQGLMVAFLVSRPVRRRALLATTLDDHLKVQTDGFHLCYGAEDMKAKRPYEFPLPERLVPFMRRYLEVHRPTLLQGKSCNALWINQCGNALTPDGLSRQLPKDTKRILGVALRPHAFRHIAATYIAETDPKNANIIRDVLGHATLDMANKHYNRAKGIGACNEYQDLITGLRKEGEKVVRK